MKTEWNYCSIIQWKYITKHLKTNNKNSSNFQFQQYFLKLAFHWLHINTKKFGYSWACLATFVLLLVFIWRLCLQHFSLNFSLRKRCKTIHFHLRYLDKTQLEFKLCHLVEFYTKYRWKHSHYENKIFFPFFLFPLQIQRGHRQHLANGRMKN